MLPIGSLGLKVRSCYLFRLPQGQNSNKLSLTPHLHGADMEKAVQTVPPIAMPSATSLARAMPCKSRAEEQRRGIAGHSFGVLWLWRGQPGPRLPCQMS